MISKTIIDTSIPDNISTLRDILCTELYYAFKSNREIVIVCIGLIGLLETLWAL